MTATTLNENERYVRLTHVAMALRYANVSLIHYFVVALIAVKLIYIIVIYVYIIAGEFFHNKNNFYLVHI